MPPLSDVALGAVFLVLFGLLYWLGRLPTIQVILGFVGTILLAGIGIVGHILSVGADWLVDAASWASFHLLGTALPLIITIIVGVITIHDMWPKHSVGRRTAFAAIVLAALIVGGQTGIPALNGVGADVRGGVTSAQQIAR